jgi:cytochrome c-type biogenesis protein CcmH
LWNGVWGLPPAGSRGRAPGLALTLAFYLATTAAAVAVSNPAEMLPDHAQELRAEAIGSQLRCMVCQNQTIEDSDADLARDLRRIVRQRVVAGDSDQQVIGWMTARYGDFVRMRPPFRPLTWVLWLSPLIALAVGIGAALLTRQRRAAPPPPLSEAEQARLTTLLQP